MLKQTTNKIQLISNEWDLSIKKIDAIKHQLINNLEQMMGIGPTQSAWKAEVLPLNYICISRHL